MLVKITPDTFINPDHVIGIILNNTYAIVTLARPLAVNSDRVVSIDAAMYLMQQMDVAQAVILPGEAGYIDPDAPTAQPLTSRIAVLLRDEFPQGASIDQLTDTLHLDYHLIVDALMSLCAERVAQFHGTDNRYYHASHYPKIYAPEREIDLLDITPFQSALRDGELQCIECKHQSCATCVTANACCECNCPNFTLRKPDNVRTCGFCGVADISRDVVWRTWREGLPYHPNCAISFDNGYKLPAVVTPSPDPLAASAAQALSPGEDTGLKEVQTSER